MSAIDRIKSNSDRAKVNAFLDMISEFEPALREEVLEICSKDVSARTYYVNRFHELQKEKELA